MPQKNKNETMSVSLVGQIIERFSRQLIQTPNNVDSQLEYELIRWAASQSKSQSCIRTPKCFHPAVLILIMYYYLFILGQTDNLKRQQPATDIKTSHTYVL